MAKSYINSQVWLCEVRSLSQLILLIPKGPKTLCCKHRASVVVTNNNSQLYMIFNLNWINIKLKRAGWKGVPMMKFHNARTGIVLDHELNVLPCFPSLIQNMSSMSDGRDVNKGISQYSGWHNYGFEIECSTMLPLHLSSLKPIGVKPFHCWTLC